MCPECEVREGVEGLILLLILLIQEGLVVIQPTNFSERTELIPPNGIQFTF